MKGQTLLQDRRFLLALGLALAVMVVILAAEIRAIGRPETYQATTDIAAVLCALIAAALYVWAFTTMAGRDISKRVWGMVTVGVLLWVIAEATWTYYELVLGIDSPYPGIADAFWLAGYIPIYAALLTRYRAFPRATASQHRLVITVFIIAYCALLIPFVIRPILESFDSSRLLESIVNMAYPLADLGLFILTLVIIFALERGRLAVIWRLFGAALILTGVADSVFAYASWNGLYYPDGQVNSISLVTDALFNAFYLLLGLAILAYVLSARAFAPGKINLVLKSLAKINILAFINSDGRVLSVSENFAQLVGAAGAHQYVGMDVATVLGLDAAQRQDLLTMIAERRSLSNYPLTIRDTNGDSRSVGLSALALYDEEKQLNVIALVLRVAAPREGEAAVPLNQEQRMLVDYYLGVVGTAKAEENHAMRVYFLEQVNLLHSLIQQFSGKAVADNLLARLGEVAQQSHWPFYTDGHEISVPEDLEGEGLAKLLSGLLREGKKFAANMTDGRMIEQEMTSLDRSLGPETRQFIDKYKLRGLLSPAA